MMSTTHDAGPWPIPIAPGPLHARIQVPGSKSETNRALVIAALSEDPSTIRGGLDARDTRLMRDALRALGVAVEEQPGQWLVTPPDRFTAAPVPINCGLAGTVMRFVPPLAALAVGRTVFVGDPEASHRPLSPLLDGLALLGATVEGNTIPCAVTGPEMLEGREVTIDSSGSSQFISGLLLVGARLPNGLVLRHRAPDSSEPPSRPHLDMTVAMLREHGVQVTETEPGLWQVLPGPVVAVDQLVEPDLTSAAVYLAAAAIAGGSVTVAGWPRETTQPGDMVREVLARMGADVALRDGELMATGTGDLHAVDIDLHEASELTPVVAALAALATGRTTIRGVAHIRGHETNRLEALEAELRRVGVQAEQTADGLVVEGVGLTGEGLHAADFRSYADHRIVHTAVLLGLVVDGCTVDDVACTSKTINDFDQSWQQMLSGSQEVDR